LPAAFTAKAGQEIVPPGGAKFTAAGGEVMDLTEDTQHNASFYTEGPGYKAKNM
jgi:hypothetical protein